MSCLHTHTHTELLGIQLHVLTRNTTRISSAGGRHCACGRTKTIIYRSSPGVRRGSQAEQTSSGPDDRVYGVHRLGPECDVIVARLNALNDNSIVLVFVSDVAPCVFAYLCRLIDV